MSLKNRKLLEQILPTIRRPSRYIGAEWNLRSKRGAEVSVALAYPDVYEVGMSNLGLQILYDIINNHPDYSCERVFAPWVDMEKQMRRIGLPLFTIDNIRPIAEFDVLGFTLQHELTFSNVLKMIDLAGLALRSKDRPDGPLVIGGGPCAFNPEPMAPFFDLFLIGDGEEAVIEILDTISAMKKRRRKEKTSSETLKELSRIAGVYVPDYQSENGRGMFDSASGDSPVVKRLLTGFKHVNAPKAPVVPYMETIHDRCVIEVMRGCTRGCRFCQAGIVYRPTRERNKKGIIEDLRVQIKNTGYNEVSLASLSTTDHSQIEEVLDDVKAVSGSNGRSVSLPSMRVDQFSVKIAAQISRMKKTGLTFAPEAGTERLRKVINKGLSDSQIIEAAMSAFEMGWSRIKLYFMIGLPTETDEDVLGIADLVKSIVWTCRRRFGEKKAKRIRLTVSVASFVPKSHTPFQWAPGLGVEEIERRLMILKDSLKSRQIDLKWHDSRSSVVEGAVARGGRDTAGAIEAAYRLGAGFDSWAECFSFDVWEKAFAHVDLDVNEQAQKGLDLDGPLPWDHILTGISKDWLRSEQRQAIAEAETDDCRDGECSLCGVCRGSVKMEIANDFQDKV